MQDSYIYSGLYIDFNTLLKYLNKKYKNIIFSVSWIGDDGKWSSG